MEYWVKDALTTLKGGQGTVTLAPGMFNQSLALEFEFQGGWQMSQTCTLWIKNC